MFKKKFEQKDMTGVLFKNDKKTTPKHPDLQGNVMINNVTYRLAAWKKEGAKGTFLSLAISEYKETAAQSDGGLDF
jgi:hypothetical protein